MSNDIIEGTIISFNANKMPLVGKRNCVILFKQRGSESQKSLEFQYWGPYINNIYPNEEFKLSLKDNIPQKILIVSRNKEIKLQRTSHKFQAYILFFILLYFFYISCIWTFTLYVKYETNQIRLENCVIYTENMQNALDRGDIREYQYFQRQYEKFCEYY